MADKKTPIHVRYVTNEAIKLLKEEMGYRNADNVISMLLNNTNPEIMKRANKIMKLKKGDS